MTQKISYLSQVMDAPSSILDDLTSQIDGVTDTFSLSQDLPVLSLYHNGLRQHDNYSKDIYGSLVLDFVPIVGDSLIVFLGVDNGWVSRSEHSNRAVKADKVTGILTAGNDKYYGTDASGTPGFYDLPSGGGSGETDILMVQVFT